MKKQAYSLHAKTRKKYSYNINLQCCYFRFAKTTLLLYIVDVIGNVPVKQTFCNVKKAADGFKYGFALFCFLFLFLFLFDWFFFQVLISMLVFVTSYNQVEPTQSGLVNFPNSGRRLPKMVLRKMSFLFNHLDVYFHFLSQRFQV